MSILDKSYFRVYTAHSSQVLLLLCLVGILFLRTIVYALVLAWYFAPFDGPLCFCGRNYIPSKVYDMCQSRNCIPS